MQMQRNQDHDKWAERLAALARLKAKQPLLDLQARIAREKDVAQK